MIKFRKVIIEDGIYVERSDNPECPIGFKLFKLEDEYWVNLIVGLANDAYEIGITHTLERLSSLSKDDLFK